ncbi:ABC transporter permease [Stieleria varia]|uniref:Phospholipid ABC transporter permease protein MlaE n=1 Tax=Stieleria varia TaxID=2528005 RepID=A0A5C6AY68_9BACT|nr:ABC transporter permease [Stieleria varia]TWU04903.1 hypothetical protein Pla52n_29480 [Stieleria varia]
MPAPLAPSIARLRNIAGSGIGWFWQLCEFVGELFVDFLLRMADIAAVLWATLALASRPRTWTPPVRAVFSRQVLFTAVDAIPAAMRFGGAVGLLLIVQAVLWADAAGISTDEIAPILWRTVVREIAPMLACLVVIGRSGIAISTELAAMRVSGEFEVIDSQGIDPMTFLIMPRVLAVMLSVFCLAMITAVTMMVTGYAIGSMMDAIRTSWNDFYGHIARNFEPEDLIFFVSKTLVAGGFAGVICCLEGVKARGRITDVPRIASRAGIRALTAVFAVSAVLSILFYNKFLVFQFG